jgi:hypothetical protein
MKKTTTYDAGDPGFYLAEALVVGTTPFTSVFMQKTYLILEMFRQCVLFHFYCWWFKIYRMIDLFVSLMVFNATFNNISDISWRSVAYPIPLTHMYMTAHFPVLVQVLQ